MARLVSDVGARFWLVFDRESVPGAELQNAVITGMISGISASLYWVFARNLEDGYVKNDG